MTAGKVMLSQDPTYLGTVASVSGSTVRAYLAESVASGLPVIDGRVYRAGQVGSFVRIPQGYQDLFGVVTEVGEKAAPDQADDADRDTGRWMQIQLVGESIGGEFERGISQFPNTDDSVHITTEANLAKIYGSNRHGQVAIGVISSAESIPALVSLDELVTRHSAILGSTGSGKSTTVASLMRSLICPSGGERPYPSARILMLDIHGEYSAALADVANVYSVEPKEDEGKLWVPYWALDAGDILDFLTGGVEGKSETVFTDKIVELKLASHQANRFPGVQESSITADTPIPFSLKRLWHDLIDLEIRTYEGVNRDQLAKSHDGIPEELVPPEYKPHAMGSKGPFLNPQAPGIRRQLDMLRSRMLDRRYDFLLHPGSWEPSLDGTVDEDLDSLLAKWIGGKKTITILDLSAMPSAILDRLIGSIMKIVYESLYWGREKSEGGIVRPLLFVMEEAHRYLAPDGHNVALEMTRKIVKEGRKYGVGAMIVSQRPSEVDETVLSQCGTYFALRLSNPSDRQRVQGTLPDGLLPLLDVLPVLRTGEAVITGEAAKLPMRCRVTLPGEGNRPKSEDPKVTEQWALARRRDGCNGEEGGYNRVVASWRAQRTRVAVKQLNIERTPVTDNAPEDGEPSQ